MRGGDTPAARSPPPRPAAWIVTGLPGYTIEHPDRQFITAAGVVPGPKKRVT
jgi:hypothetical protein